MAGGVAAARGGPVPYHAALAAAAILGLLALLCCYACYFFVSKIRELTASEPAAAATAVTAGKERPAAAYPVLPVVRDSATAMAALCRQLPAAQGDQVFPGGRSPGPRAALASPPRKASLAAAAPAPCLADAAAAH